MADSAAPPAKEAKVDHAQPSDNSPAPTSPSSPGGGAPSADTDAQPAEQHNSSDTEQQSKGNSQDSAMSTRSAGVKVDDLKTVADLFDDGSLEPCDDQDDVEHPHSAQANTKVVLWRGDITKLEVDCIVNAANKSLLGGGGVDGAIHSAAGPDLLAECRTLDGADTGETKLTAGYRLPAKHIAHTVGPIYRASGSKAESERLLRSCYRSTLDLCIDNDIRTVAFSGISTGIYGYPIQAAAETACDEVRKFLDGPNGDKIDKVIFCVFRQVDVDSYLDALPAFFPPPPKTAAAPAEDDKGKSATAGGVEETTAEAEEPAKVGSEGASVTRQGEAAQVEEEKRE
ncbi:hypothetical protein JCM9279_004529 [Rhodotorula babjevae]